MIPAESGGGGSSSLLKPDTPFNQKGLKDLKAMLEDVNVGTVEEIAQNWLDVHDLLVGTDGQGGILKQFTDAVKKVLETWHGDSADGFAKEASKIATNFANGAPYAKNASDVMFDTAKTLQDAYGQVMAIQEPSLLDSGLDYLGNTLSSGAGAAGLISNTILPGSGGVVSAIGGMFGMSTGRDETQLNADLANPNISTAQALNNNRGQISEEKERSLEAAVHMESLALNYKTYAKRLPTPTDARDDTIPEHQNNGNGNDQTNVGAIAAVPTGVVSPTAVSGNYRTPTTSGSSYTPISASSPKIEGVSGGIGSSSAPKSTIASTPIAGSSIGTGLDGLSTGTGGTGGGGVGGIGGGYSGGAGSVGSGSSSLGGTTGSSTSGLPGVSGSTLGSTGAGRTGAGTGRAGTPGMGGAAGAGKGGAKGGMGTGRGALARQKGGVVGAAKGKSGSGAQGGSGLHRSRGGTQAGTGSKSGRGMAAAPGAHGRGKGDEEGREGQRPDYLVEDEETWTPERNVAPRVIE